ncbi:MAG: hypothetical protein KDE14_00965 [Rhodobacteraceae bacterium]|nr:hypothetical protein [Paracoccaceae bacterium]
MPDVRNLVTRLFGLGRKDEPLLVGEPSAATESNAQIEPASAWDDGLELSLGKLITEVETKASGRVQVLTLSHLRAQLGDEWDRFKSRVELISETTIGRMIGKGNIYIPHEDDSWLLIMPLLSEAEAERKADEIATVIGEKLVGERFSEKELPFPQSAKIDLSTAVNDDGSLNLEALKTSVRRTRLLLAAREARRPSRAIETGSPTVSAKSPLDGNLVGAQSRFSELTLVYRPSWSADTNAMDIFSLRAFDSSGDPLFGTEPYSRDSIVNDATMIDIAKAAFADFNTLVKSGLRARYVMPLPFAIMRRKISGAFLKAISALPQKDRLMHLRIEIVGIPQNATPDQLIDLREMFRGRVREVAMLCDLFAPVRAVFTLDHIVIGGELSPGQAIEDETLANHLDDFRRRGGARRCYLAGARSRTQVSLATRLGYDEVSGMGLSDDYRHLPDRITVMPRESLLP